MSKFETSFTAADRIDSEALTSFILRTGYTVRVGGVPDNSRNILISTYVESGTDTDEVSEQIRRELEEAGIKIL